MKKFKQAIQYKVFGSMKKEFFNSMTKLAYWLRASSTETYPALVLMIWKSFIKLEINYHSRKKNKKIKNL